MTMINALLAGKTSYSSDRRVRILTSRPLYDSVASIMDDQSRIPVFSQVLERAARLQHEWDQIGTQVLDSIEAELGVRLLVPVDAYVSPWFSQSISSPLILNTGAAAHRQVSVLIHELAHLYLTDNNKYSIHLSSQPLLGSRWREHYGDLPFETLIHVPVHAVLKMVYLDVLNKPELLDEDIEYHRKYPAYEEAWQLVNNRDYRQILVDLRKMYAKLVAGRN